MYQIETVTLNGRDVRVLTRFEHEGATLDRWQSYLFQPERARWCGLRVRPRVELGGPIQAGLLSAQMDAAARDLEFFLTSQN